MSDVLKALRAAEAEATTERDKELFRSAAGEIEILRAAAAMALDEMCRTVAPRASFTVAVDALDAALYPMTEHQEKGEEHR